MISWSLELELWRWRRLGRTPILWWRDDDARTPTPELARLRELAERRRLPLTLAVIPDGDRSALAAAIAGWPRLSVAQHGVDHLNRRTGRAAGEFPTAWRRLRMATAIQAGWRRMQVLPGPIKVFVPPWNDIHPDLAGTLADCGFQGLSAWGALDPASEPARRDAHLDLLRWVGGARFRGRRRFARALAAQLAARRRSGRFRAPIGLLTHHLDHDEAAWRFLDRFLVWTAPRFDWRALADLLPPMEAKAARPA